MISLCYWFRSPHRSHQDLVFFLITSLTTLGLTQTPNTHLNTNPMRCKKGSVVETTTTVWARTRSPEEHQMTGVVSLLHRGGTQFWLKKPKESDWGLIRNREKETPEGRTGWSFPDLPPLTRVLRFGFPNRYELRSSFPFKGRIRETITLLCGLVKRHCE